jgi:hypothetical protein
MLQLAPTTPQLETGNWKLEVGNRKALSIDSAKADALVFTGLVNSLHVFSKDGVEFRQFRNQQMAYPDSDEERRTLVDGLMRQAHEQSRHSAERSPFWREGTWRCEFHRQAGDARLKLFSGARCVHEEPVQDRARADVRAQELRTAVRARQRGDDVRFGPDAD